MTDETREMARQWLSPALLLPALTFAGGLWVSSAIQQERVEGLRAKAQGLIDVLLRPTTERLQQQHEQLEADVARAGYVLDKQGRVVRAPQTETVPALETTGASKEP